jgi:hypothetical protein
MVTAAAPSAIDIEQQCAVEMERGRRLGAAADGELARARVAFDRAESERDEAVKAGIRGDDDADERLATALSAIRDAADRITVAQMNSKAAREVFEEARARQLQVRTTLVDELVPSAEALSKAAIEARDALREPLERYIAAYRGAARRWGDLFPGTIAKVEADDAARGDYSDAGKLRRQASCPPLPLDADVIRDNSITDVVGAVLNTTPMPPMYCGADAESVDIATSEAGPRPIFPGMEGHQRHTKGVTDTEPVPRPNGWDRFRESDALQRALGK